MYSTQRPISPSTGRGNSSGMYYQTMRPSSPAPMSTQQQQQQQIAASTQPPRPHTSNSHRTDKVLVDDPTLRGGSNETGGVGIIFVEGLDGERSIHIMTFVRGGPAERDGSLKIGDIIVEVDGFDVRRETLTAVRRLILGPPGVPVTLTFRRPGQSQLVQVTLTRENPDESRGVEQRLRSELQSLRDRYRQEIVALERENANVVSQLQQKLADSEARAVQLEKEMRTRIDAADRERRARLQLAETHEESVRESENAKRSLQSRVSFLENENNTLREELQQVWDKVRILSSTPPPAPPPPQIIQAPPPPPITQERVTVIESTMTGTAGVGLILDDDPRMEKFKVHLLVRGSSAAMSGKIAEGDFVIGVDSFSVAGRPLSVVKDFIKGPIGTPVILHLTRGDTGEHFSVTLVRGRELNTETRRVIRDASPPLYPSGNGSGRGSEYYPRY